MLSVPLAWLVGASVMRRVELVAAVAFVLVVELLNTAIEKLADRLTTYRSFEQAARLDPGCAMAYWGKAFCHGPHINNPVMDEPASIAARNDSTS